MNSWFLLAALCSAAVCLTHIILGGRAAAVPLLAADGLNKVAKYTNYYCWHIVTIVLAGQALAFALVAQAPDERLLAMFTTGSAIAFFVWNLAMIAIFKLRLMHFPQWLLFIPSSGLGLMGLYL